MSLNYTCAITFALLSLFPVSNCVAQSWVIGGNTIGAGSNDFGSLDNQPVDFITNGAVRMRIRSGGNVGIGTTSASEKLEINGNLRLTSGQNFIQFGNPGVSPQPMMYMFTSGTDNFNRMVLAHSPSNPGWGLQYDDSDDQFDFQSNVFGSISSILSIDLSDGNVGIGTSDPSYPLDVYGDINLGLASNSIMQLGTPVIKFDRSQDNIFIGSQAGSQDELEDVATNNTFVGDASGRDNTYGEANSFFGSQSGLGNTLGYNNCFFGFGSGLANTTGIYNCFFGSEAGAFNAGNLNSFFGATSGLNNEGDENSFFGHEAGYYNAEGHQNSFFGSEAGERNTSGSHNCFFGEEAGFENTTASYNSFFGSSAGSNNSLGGNNSFFGYSAGFNNSTGLGNTFIGRIAGDIVTIGNNNTCIGYLSDIDMATFNNSTAIGYNTGATASNQVRVGDIAVTSIGGYAGWTNVSDGRFKKEIKENVPGLDFINMLTPVTYHIDASGIKKFIASMNDAEENESGQEALNEKEAIVYTGFIAQDVEAAARKINYNFSGIDAPQNEHDLYGLRYAEFVVPLVKAVQELDEENEILSAGLLAEKTKNQMLEERISKLESLIPGIGNDGAIRFQSEINPDQSGSKSEILLGQNIPNPFDNSTLIPFRIPNDCNEAAIVITESSTGRVLRTILVQCHETQLMIEAGTLPAGNYNYSLMVDGKVMATKRMELLR